MRKSCLALPTLGLVLLGAVPARAADSKGISIAGTYIVFLHYHSTAVQRQASGEARPNVLARAEWMKIEPGDLEALDRAALAFVEQEGLLREEALRYHADVEARGGTADPAVVRSFSDRREALALDAFRSLKTSFSLKSYAGLHVFLAKDFSQSITRFSR